MASENIRKDLPLDKPVQIVLLPGRSIHFACPTGTLGGDIDVQ